MASCPQCGATVNAGASFCSACGMTLAAVANPSVLVAAPPAAPAARVRPTGVTIIGVVTVVGGAFLAMVALAIVLFFGAFGAMFGAFFPTWGDAVGGALSVLALIGAIFVVGIAVLAIVTGVGVLRGSGWAWPVMIGLMGLNALNGLSEVATRQYTSALVTILVSGLVIWYFFQPDVQRWFGRAPS